MTLSEYVMFVALRYNASSLKLIFCCYVAENSHQRGRLNSFNPSLILWKDLSCLRRGMSQPTPQPGQQQQPAPRAPSTTQVVQFPVAVLLTQLGSVECCRLKGPLICPAVIHQQLLKPLKLLFIIFNAYRRPHSAFLFCSLLPLCCIAFIAPPPFSKPWKSIFYSCSAWGGGVHVFGVPQRGERSGRFQGSAWLFLPEGFGVPQTKQQNILRCRHVVCVNLQFQDMLSKINKQNGDFLFFDM